jgi:hypothetical protein
MKKQMIFVVALMALFFLTLVGPSAQKARATGGDDLPCDPSPTMIRMCELRGGTFNFATCRCEFR